MVQYWETCPIIGDRGVSHGYVIILNQTLTSQLNVVERCDSQTDIPLTDSDVHYKGHTGIMVYWYNGSSYLVWRNSILRPTWYDVSLLFGRFQEKQEVIFAYTLYKNCIIMPPPLVFSKNIHKATIHYTNLAV